MKLTQHTQNTLVTALELANTMGMDALILDKTGIRSHNQEDGTILLMHTKDSDLEFDSIAIGRVDVLLQRLRMFKNCNIEYELMEKTTDDTKVVSSLKIISGRTKLGYKCHDPSRLKIVRSIADPEFYEISLSLEDVKSLVSGINAMKSDNMHFGSDDTDVTLTISDTQGDSFSHRIQNSLVYLTDNTQSLSKTYKCKILSTVFNKCVEKNTDGLNVKVTKRGILVVPSYNMNIYVFPER